MGSSGGDDQRIVGQITAFAVRLPLPASLNNRARKTLGFMTPSEKLAQLLAPTV
jgi:hypothetical protein